VPRTAGVVWCGCSPYGRPPCGGAITGRGTAMLRDKRPEFSVRPSGPADQTREISPVLQRMVIIARIRGSAPTSGSTLPRSPMRAVDDAHGFWSAVGAAWRTRPAAGASTIPAARQESLSLVLAQSDPQGEGAVTALRLELALSKDRSSSVPQRRGVGPGIWGVDGASRAYFGVPASRLTEEQAARARGHAAASLPRTRRYSERTAGCARNHPLAEVPGWTWYSHRRRKRLMPMPP